MLFNSIEFLLFLPIVFAAYWILNIWTERSKILRLMTYFGTPHRSQDMAEYSRRRNGSPFTWRTRTPHECQESL